MFTIIVVLVASATTFTLLLLVIVIVGIRKEPSTEELSQQASSLVAAFVRRLLGLHVRKPNSSPSRSRGDERLSLARVTPLPDSIRKPNRNER